MTSREIILKAFEGGKPERVPVTLFGGGMWSIRDYGSMSGKLLCDISYAGSGYNNFHASAFGGGIKFREMGAPDLEESFISSEDDLKKLDIAKIDSSEVIETVFKALRDAKSTIGNEYVVTMTAWGPYTLGARMVGEEVMMKATFKNPDFVHKVTDFAADLLIHLYESLVTDGTLEVISLADPTAQHN
jgi:uroporphyrinogen decarboxylase